MENYATIIVVLTLLVALLAVADKYKLPTPILLVLSGLAIGFVPSMPAITLDPAVVFLIFLPPILYDAASNTDWHDFKSEFRPIATLAIALVIFTTGAVAITSYFLIPGFTWPLAFVLGAIVSPPDAVAATTITKGLGLNKKVVTILEGESLLNDASALIAYRFSVAAIGTGSFIVWQAGIDFLLVVAGGTLMGAVVGSIFVIVHKKILDNSIISTSLSLLTPFVAYLAAEYFHVSGILSVVCAGLVISRRAPDVFSYQTRIRHRAVWDTLIFLLNGFVFILIGLQLRSILADLKQYSVMELMLYGALVSGITILIRIFWVLGAGVLTSAVGNNRKESANRWDKDTWKNVAIVAWTGTRGVVSLATALALPLTVGAVALPQRSLILFIAFVVIFATLVIQGISLPLLLKILKVKPQDTTEGDERALRLSITHSVLNFIDVELTGKISDVTRTQVKKQYIDMIESLKERERMAKSDATITIELSPEHELTRAQSEINKFQRKLLIEFHQAGTFEQTALRQYEQKLDLEELLFSRTKKKSLNKMK
ncbi:Na+/H+ antiporter [Pseudochryseolinea flava]|uniref:Na+/H+ antiporter n=1 Tax=Pseudochryseolinea flava TaxID=2059302 RepID=A0A364Y587_9BACT|nr:Na+/H+ antiporter [Pseudochryseolinea flava]RAW02029.1 Na+/H+ antiporter [Pseudochryseolinea flava]